MSTNVVNQVAYLRTTRDFQEELGQLSVEMNRAYVDIASAVNNRTIAIFPTNKPAVTGESWYFDKNQRQQGLRQIYVFTSTASIAHGINLSRIDRFVRCWGEFTDGTNWYGLIHASSVAIPGQISFYLTPTNITFVTEAGAPTLKSGSIVLEWLSVP
jgi:hypothetical protein